MNKEILQKAKELNEQIQNVSEYIEKIETAETPIDGLMVAFQSGLISQESCLEILGGIKEAFKEHLKNLEKEFEEL